jgi:hypothetical protein
VHEVVPLHVLATVVLSVASSVRGLLCLLRGCRPLGHSALTTLCTSSLTPAAMRCWRVHSATTGGGGDALLGYNLLRWVLGPVSSLLAVISALLFLKVESGTCDTYLFFFLRLKQCLWIVPEVQRLCHIISSCLFVPLINVHTHIPDVRTWKSR